MSPVVADEAAAHPGIPGLVRKLEDPPMRLGQAAGIPRLAYPKAAVPAPEPALFREPAESAPEPALFREPTESAPGVCSPVLICCLASCVYIECTKLSACLFFPFGWFLFLVLFHYLKDPLPTFESSPSSLQSIPDIYG